MTDELKRHIYLIAEEDLERNQEHLAWLGENPNEPDRDQQIAESECSIELDRQLMRMFK